MVLAIVLTSVFWIIILAWVLFKNSKLKSLIKQLNLLTSDLSGCVEQVTNLGTSLDTASAEQLDSIAQTVSASHEINMTIARNTDFAKELNIESEELSKYSTEGSSIVNNMVLSSEEIKNQSKKFQEEIVDSLTELNGVVKYIQEISEKTKMINDIVFQTKLLSFNASVEAARAGEHGKGFAVVAEEVGKLAQMSGATASEITSIVDKSVKQVQTMLMSTISKVEMQTNQVAQKSEKGHIESKKCEAIFAELSSKVSNISGKITDITSATFEQAKGINQLDLSIASLQEAADRNRLMAGQSNENAHILHDQVNNLNELVIDLSKYAQSNTNEKYHLDQFIWTDKLLIGVNQMDDEHIVLVERINTLVVELEKFHTSLDKSPVLIAFKNMANYTVEHFSHEENYMRSINYPQLASHQKIHQQLLEQVGSYESQISNGTLDDKKLISFLRNWLVSHIMGIDTKYAKFSKDGR